MRPRAILFLRFESTGSVRRGGHRFGGHRPVVRRWRAMMRGFLVGRGDFQDRWFVEGLAEEVDADRELRGRGAHEERGGLGATAFAFTVAAGTTAATGAGGGRRRVGIE